MVCLVDYYWGCLGVVCAVPLANNVRARVKWRFWLNQSPRAQGSFTSNAQAARSLLPFKHGTHKFTIFSLKFLPHHQRCNWNATILFTKTHWELSPPHLNNCNRTGWINLGAKLICRVLCLYFQFLCATWLVCVCSQRVAVNNVWIL